MDSGGGLNWVVIVQSPRSVLLISIPSTYLRSLIVYFIHFIVRYLKVKKNYIDVSMIFLTRDLRYREASDNEHKTPLVATIFILI